MNHPLLRKEVRSLAPFLVLVLFFNLLDWADEFLTKFPDQYPLAKLLEESTGGQVMMFMMAFALGASLLVREADDGTLAFLDGLPLTRTRVFLTKAGLALGVLWLLPFSDLVLKILLCSWSRTSLEPKLWWQPLVTGALLDATSCFIYLSLGLALSFLGRFSLLVVGVFICAYLLLQERQVPFVALFNIFNLNAPSFQGRHWLIPKSKLAVQLGLSVVCFGIAFGAFHMMGDAAQRFAERVKRRRGAVIIGGAGMVLAVFLWIGLFVYWGEHSDNDSEHKVSYQQWKTSRALTTRYEFLYPENQGALVNQLLDRADSVEGRVRQFLRAQPMPSIMADLTGSSPSTLGLAHWKRVQIDLAKIAGGVDELEAVLGHETTHVYISHECEYKIADDFDATRFFHEGLATYVEYHLFRPDEQLPRLMRVAATMHARHEVDFDELFDSAALARKRDTDLVYPLGEAFVAALINRYGDKAAGNVVRAFARPDAPKGLKGIELWRDILRASGGNLSEVEDFFFAELDRAVTQQRWFVDSLPRLSGSVRKEGSDVVVRTSYQGPPASRIVCRFRPSADTPDRLYLYPSSHESDIFRLSRANLPEQSFWYQLGWSEPNASQPIYEPWVEVPLK